MQDLLQALVDFGPHAQRFTKGWRADRQDHILLHVGRVIGVFASIEDIHHGHRQGASCNASQIAVEWLLFYLGSRFGNGERDAQDGIRAQFHLVRRPVKLDHYLVQHYLIDGIQPDDRLADGFIDIAHGGENPLATVATLVAIAQLYRLVRSC